MDRRLKTTDLEELFHCIWLKKETGAMEKELSRDLVSPTSLFRSHSLWAFHLGFSFFGSLVGGSLVLFCFVFPAQTSPDPVTEGSGDVIIERSEEREKNLHSVLVRVWRNWEVWLGTHPATGLRKTCDSSYWFCLCNCTCRVVGVEEGHTMGDIHDSQANQSKWLATPPKIRPPA